MKTHTQIQIKGIVQGVGFRPFVFTLAKKTHSKCRFLIIEFSYKITNAGFRLPLLSLLI
ncbi:MAG: acylphosphatase [Aridibacter sp.]